MILPDSNAWIYALDEGLPEHPHVAPLLWNRLEEDDALIPTTVQLEVLHYLAGQVEDPERLVDTFLAYPGEVAPLTLDVVTDASRLVLRHRSDGIGSRDATILVHAKRHGAHLLTADQALLGVARDRGLDAMDPTA